MAEGIVIIAFYKFVPLPDCERLRKPYLRFCQKHNIRGSILLAEEGINATLSGTREDIDAYLDFMRSDKRFTDIEWKESYADFQPFGRMKVRLKEEIVRMGLPDIDMSKIGTYVESDEWEKLIEDPEVLLVDTRNDYEVRIGKFKNALDPNIKNFRDFPRWVKENLDPQKHKKVAMYCTGGIRCEKTTAYLKNLGFDDVYHLKGGILKYLEDKGQEGKAWEGSCFVFDDRVAVDHTLDISDDLVCEVCGGEIKTDDLKWTTDPRVICAPCLREEMQQAGS